MKNEWKMSEKFVSKMCVKTFNKNAFYRIVVITSRCEILTLFHKNSTKINYVSKSWFFVENFLFDEILTRRPLIILFCSHLAAKLTDVNFWPSGKPSWGLWLFSEKKLRVSLKKAGPARLESTIFKLKIENYLFSIKI